MLEEDFSVILFFAKVFSVKDAKLSILIQINLSATPSETLNLQSWTKVSRKFIKTNATNYQ